MLRYLPIGLIVALAASLNAGFALPDSTPADPLPSWNDGATKQAIIAFVKDVTSKESKHYVAPTARIAVFDNDGTLWCEQPMYVEMVFSFDRLKALAHKHPELKTKPAYHALLNKDVKALASLGKQSWIDLTTATHAGMTPKEFETIVRDWMATTRHPRFKRPYTDLVYQPMREVLAYLRANGFKTYIVSGGGIEFMRPWTEKTYGIPPEQVIGSTIKTKFEMRGGKPILFRLKEMDYIDNYAGKPISINKFIGRRPIAAFGNSDGDLEMLQWTSAGEGRRLGLIVHHTDAEREYAYDRKSQIGRLDKALDEAKKEKWLLADMKKDWKRIFPFDK